MTHHQNFTSSALETFPENLIEILNNLRRVRLHESVNVSKMTTVHVEMLNGCSTPARPLVGSVACSTFATNAQVLFLFCCLFRRSPVNGP